MMHLDIHGRLAHDSMDELLEHLERCDLTTSAGRQSGTTQNRDGRLRRDPCDDLWRDDKSLKIHARRQERRRAKRQARERLDEVAKD